MEEPRNPIFLHPKVFSWLSWDQIDHPSGSASMVRRPHEICEHATSRISNASTDHDLVDGICALKRAIMLRTKSLRELYKLKHLPLEGFPKEQFDQLLELGMIKPLLLSKVIEVRRIVEHMHLPPPPKDRCKELCEFTWYFLKATDVYVSRLFDGMRTAIGGDEKNLGYEIYISISPSDDWTIDVHGELPPQAVSFEMKEGWFRLEPKYVYANKDAPPSAHFFDDKFIPKIGDMKETLKPDDFLFGGEPDAAFRSHLIRRYFAIIA